MDQQRHMCSQMASNIPQEVVTGNAKKRRRWPVTPNQRPSPQVKRFGWIGFYDHMMQWANQLTGWVTTQSSRKSIIPRPADDGMAARNPLGKGKGTWFCVSVCVFVCARACRHTCLSLLYLHNSSYFAAHSCPDCLGTEGGGGADCWDAWRRCLHAVALSSLTLTHSRWGID